MGIFTNSSVGRVAREKGKVIVRCNIDPTSLKLRAVLAEGLTPIEQAAVGLVQGKLAKRLEGQESGYFGFVAGLGNCYIGGDPATGDLCLFAKTLKPSVTEPVQPMAV